MNGTIYFVGLTEFSEWLEKELRLRNMTQAELTRKSGLSIAQVSRIVNMQSPAGVHALDSIAKAFDLPVETVFRAAGILPELPTLREAIKEIMQYKLNELTDDQVDEVLKFIEFIQYRDDLSLNKDD